MADNGQNTEDVYERVRNAILDGRARARSGDVAGRAGPGPRDQPDPAARGAPDAAERGSRRGRAEPPRPGGSDDRRRPRGAVRHAHHARGGGAAPVGAADDVRGSRAARGTHGRDGALRRGEGLPALEPPARAVSPWPDRSRRRAGQLRARADVRPRRALPPAAHRPRPDRVGDRAITARSSTPARPGTGTGAPACWPRIWRGPGSRSPSCSTRTTARSCSSWRWPTPAALRRTRVAAARRADSVRIRIDTDRRWAPDRGQRRSDSRRPDEHACNAERSHPERPARVEGAREALRRASRASTCASCSPRTRPAGSGSWPRAPGCTSTTRRTGSPTRPSGCCKRSPSSPGSPTGSRRCSRGERINVSENRSVLHVALRMPRSASLIVDGVDVVKEVHEVLDRMAAFSDRVRSGEWRGHTGQADPQRRQHRHRRLGPRAGDGVRGAAPLLAIAT